MPTWVYGTQPRHWADKECPLLSSLESGPHGEYNKQRQTARRDGSRCNDDSLQRYHAVLTASSGQDIPSSVVAAAPSLDGKILLMVGDSLAGGQYFDLLCSLYSLPGINVAAVLPNRADPNLVGSIISEVQSNSSTCWLVHISIESINPDTQAGASAGYLTRGSIAKIGRWIAIGRSAYRGNTTRGTIILLTSVKAHSLSSHGYKGYEDGGTHQYFKDLIVFIESMSKLVHWELFYYRPAFATHFATAHAGYIPGAKELALPCKAIDANITSTPLRDFFTREEANLSQRAKTAGLRVVVVPHTWEMSLQMWHLHPSLTHQVHPPYGNVVDCLHFCVLGNAYYGMYEAVNRWWWWSMLLELKRIKDQRRSRFKQGGEYIHWHCAHRVHTHTRAERDC